MNLNVSLETDNAEMGPVRVDRKRRISLLANPLALSLKFKTKNVLARMVDVLGKNPVKNICAATQCLVLS